MRLASLTVTCVCVCACVCQGRLTASAVGHIVGLQSEEIKQIASEYAEKVTLRCFYTSRSQTPLPVF